MTTQTARSSALGPPRGQGVRSAISSEFIKIISVPTQRALLFLAIGIPALMAALFYVSLPVTQGRALGDLESSEILSTGILGVDAAAFVAIIIAALHVGSEYSTGMIQSTLTITPARGRVLAGKVVTAGVTSLAIGVIAAATCVGAALIVAGALGHEPSVILTAAGIRLAAGSIAMPVLYSVIAASAAFVFRSSALGIVVPLGVMAAGGLAGWFGDSVGALLTALLPVAAIHTLSGVATGPESIGLVGATISIVAWLGVSVGAAAWRLLRHDA